MSDKPTDIRRRALEEAAVEICGYCRGVKGIDPVPSEASGELVHLFTRGNGSNPCSSGKIWAMVAEEKAKLILPPESQPAVPAADPLCVQPVAEPNKITDWDERYRTMPPVKCECGQRDIPAAIDGVQWYWQRHARTGCTLELPDSVCWCGLKRSEHIKGHADKPSTPDPICRNPDCADVQKLRDTLREAAEQLDKPYQQGNCRAVSRKLRALLEEADRG